MATANGKRCEDEGVIAEADVIRDEERWAGQLFNVLASGHRHGYATARCSISPVKSFCTSLTVVAAVKAASSSDT
jgi:hypothetical protein